MKTELLRERTDSDFKHCGLESLNLLIIDDDREDFLVLKELLEEGFAETKMLQVDYAVDYEAALVFLEKSNYHLVFIDYKLGDHDGIEILDAIKKLEKSTTTNVFFVTGQGNESVAANAIKHGARDYLIKDELSLALIKDVLFSFVSKPKLNSRSVKLFMDHLKEPTKASVRPGMLHDLINLVRNKSKTPFISAKSPEKIDCQFFVAFDDFVRI